MSIHIIIVVMAVLSELLGAVIFLKTKKSIARLLLSCLGLGFVVVIVFMDVLPDVDFYKAENLPKGILLCIAGAAAAFGLVKLTKHWGNFAATAGIGLHNFGEGLVIAGLGTISPLLIIGFLLHKLPEGMVSFSILDGFKERTRFLIAAGVALMIPLGALLPIPENVEQPVMTFGAGIILYIASRFAVRVIKDNTGAARPVKWAIITGAAVIGAVVGGISCLIA